MRGVRGGAWRSPCVSAPTDRRTQVSSRGLFPRSNHRLAALIDGGRSPGSGEDIDPVAAHEPLDHLRVEYAGLWIAGTSPAMTRGARMGVRTTYTNLRPVILSRLP